MNDEQDPFVSHRLEHYPQRRYVDPKKPLAPEKKFTAEDIAALARATNYATRVGILTPEVAQYVLPMALVEGRPGNHGVKATEKPGFYAKPSTLKRFEAMGLTYDSEGAPLMREGNFVGPNPARPQDPDTAARLMVGILAEKAALAKDPEDAVRRYNGAVGNFTELMEDGSRQPANAATYLAKVKEAAAMLAHPKNEKLRSYYDAIMHGDEPPDIFPPKAGLMPPEAAPATAPQSGKPEGLSDQLMNIIRRAKAAVFGEELR